MKEPRFFSIAQSCGGRIDDDDSEEKAAANNTNKNPKQLNMIKYFKILLIQVEKT